MTDKLKAMRDRMAEEIVPSVWSHDGSDRHADLDRQNFKSGFDACAAILLPEIERLREALEELNEHTACHLENMEHYFENKCCPTADEVNACAVADSKVRVALGRLYETLGDGE